jgi:ectoine hydroxylase-related dioxygenase (phytanoyl-CoA dioxygenase family)
MDKPTSRFDADAHAAEIRERGYTIIEDFLNGATLAEVRRTLAPYLGSHHGRNDFEGFLTERVYTLVARGKVFEDLAEDPRLLALLDRFLQPNFLLTASQAIRINPGENAQGLHTDDSFYRQPRPRPAISYTMIAAVDAFTEANGATQVIPGSHLWGDPGSPGRPDDPAVLAKMLVPLEMPAGACVVFPGTLVHQGGANRTDKPRQAFTNQYCEGWARTQENFYLSIPKEMVRAMSPRLQALLGYEIWPSFMGMVTASHPSKALAPDWIPPIVSQRPG